MTLPDPNYSDRPAAAALPPDALEPEETLETSSPTDDPQVTRLEEAAPSSVTAGDPDALAYRAVGEEAVGGTTPTPDQNDVGTIAAAAGVPLKPEHPVGIKRRVDRRDEQRFELDPASLAQANSLDRG